jgi:hypothetical protein
MIPVRVKYAVEDRVISFDFTAKLVAGETVTTASVTPAAGVTASPPAINVGGYLVTTTVSAGTAGNDYPVTCVAETSGGRTLKLVFSLEVRDDAN